MARIFISHARSTAQKARLIFDGLRQAGYEVWIDDQLLGYGSFADAIEEQLNAADAVVVAWSADAVRSEWVRAEADRARHASKLIQVMLERCALPLPFDQIHCIELFSWSGDYEVRGWRSVLASVAALTTGEERGRGVALRGRRSSRSGAIPVRERRQVTALVCDLMDADSLSARLDPEDMMQILDVWQAACDDVFTQHAGNIAAATGHRVLAYFGYPRAEEEEAANAVRAALALCDAVAHLEWPGGITVGARVGVATGLVVVADLVNRASVAEADVVGETPDLAAQLQSVAPANGVVVSEATRRITEGLFTYREIDAKKLAGYGRPIVGFEATGVTAAASRSQARGQSGQKSIFGRGPELASLRDSWALAAEGEGQVLLVQGEAGIGKSRLVDAFRQIVTETSRNHSTWYCAPNYSTNALHPVREQLGRVAGFTEEDSQETRSAKIDGLMDEYGPADAEGRAVISEFLGAPGETASLAAMPTPDRRKAVTLESLLSMMARMANAQPAMFVIEDLQWADPTTLELLDRAVRRSSEHSWLILATARPEFDPGWSEYADFTHIQLGGLGRADSARICAELGAEALLPSDMVRQIITRSDGNPLFIEEMTRSVLEAVAGAGPQHGVAQVAIPTTLKDSLAARLDRLGAAKQVARLGAAIGRRFSYELLAAIAAQPETELRHALRELARAGLVERSGVPPNSRYLFRHALIRDAAYESLLRREREGLHGRIAAALREHFPETLRSDPGLVAYHLTESGAIAEAIPFWVTAGQRAAGQAAHAEAASFLQTARELLKKVPDDPARAGQELPVLLGLATSLSASRGYSIPEVGKALAEALAICDSLGNVSALFSVLRGIFSFSITASDLPAAEKAALRCAEISEQSGLPEHRIEADHAWGLLLTARGDLAGAREHFERAIKVCRETDCTNIVFPSVPGPLPLCLGLLPLVLYALGDNAGAERVSRELIELLPSLGRGYDLTFGAAWHCCYSLMRKNYARAVTFADQVLSICEENGYDTYASVAIAEKGAALGHLRDMDAALAMAARGIAELDRLGVMNMFTFHLAEVARLRAAAGQVTEGLATIDRAIAHALKNGDQFYLSPAYHLRAEILGMLPDTDPSEIAAALREAIAVATAQGAVTFVADAKSLLDKVSA